MQENEKDKRLENSLISSEKSTRKRRYSARLI